MLYVSDSRGGKVFWWAKRWGGGGGGGGGDPPPPSDQNAIPPGQPLFSKLPPSGQKNWAVPPNQFLGENFGIFPCETKKILLKRGKN